MSELVEEAILGGVTMIQLREKEMTHEAFKQEALDVQSVCQKHHVPLIINDDVELCKEIDADGVHIGQDDLNLKEARKILGEDKIIGVSAHNYEEAKILVRLFPESGLFGIEWTLLHLFESIFTQIEESKYIQLMAECPSEEWDKTLRQRLDDKTK